MSRHFDSMSSAYACLQFILSSKLFFDNLLDKIQFEIIVVNYKYSAHKLPHKQVVCNGYRYGAAAEIGFYNIYAEIFAVIIF